MHRLFPSGKPVIQTFNEQSALFFGLIRWTFLASLIGSFIGLSTWAFITLLNHSIQDAEAYPYLFLALPATLLLTTLFIRVTAPDAAGHGTEKVIEAVHTHSGRVRLRIAPIKTLATIVTIALGGSAGKEGPAAQIGASIASGAASLLRLSERDRKKLVVCGISAGFASVFGTPVAGAIFGIEVLFLGHILYDVLVPSFIAGITAYQVSRWLGLTYWSHRVIEIPAFSQGLLLQIILTGVVFALVTVIFIETFRFFKRTMTVIWPNPYGRAAMGGVLLIGVSLIFGQEILGLGAHHIERVFEGQPVKPFDWLGKILATSITLEAGGSGGVVTPIFFIGATFGSLWGTIIGVSPTTMAALGTTSVLSGAANTPIAASMMAIEMFGPEIGPYAAGCAMVSFLMTGHRSVYPSQVLAVQKSEVLRGVLQKPIASALASRLNEEGQDDLRKVYSIPRRIWQFITSGIWMRRR